MTPDPPTGEWRWPTRPASMPGDPRERLPWEREPGRHRAPAPEHARGSGTVTPERASGPTHRQPPPTPPPARKRGGRPPGGYRPPARRWRRALIVGRVAVAMVAICALATTGFGNRLYHRLSTGIVQSNVLHNEPTAPGTDMNLLIMGLDSRLDEKGQPLPKDIYDALHAGDDSVGGFNSNVLILLHIPGDGSKATAISIPRDDYADLYGCGTTGTLSCGKGKIKEGYGQAYAREKDRLSNKGMKDGPDLEKAGRDAGRLAEIYTVQHFLGLTIDNYVEVTMVAFFQLAEQVQPIPVCLNQNTSDSYSGAKFVKGPQLIDARQAVSFVRQRRDPNEDLLFTDLDRNRRQQAFLIGLSHKLQESGTLTNLGKLEEILNVVKANIAVGSEPDIAVLAKIANKLTGGNVTFFTLPIDHFGQTDDGADVNIVDLDTIRAIVKHLLSPPASSTTSTTTTNPAAPTAIADADGVTLNVVNSSGQSGMAGQLEKALSARGFIRGQASTGKTRSSTIVEYGSGSSSPAQAVGKILGLGDATANTGLPPNSVRITIGTDFTPPPNLIPQSEDTANTATTSKAVPAPVSATGTGANMPAPTDLVSLGGAGIPCVK